MLARTVANVSSSFPNVLIVHHDSRVYISPSRVRSVIRHWIGDSLSLSFAFVVLAGPVFRLKAYRLHRLHYIARPYDFIRRLDFPTA